MATKSESSASTSTLRGAIVRLRSGSRWRIEQAANLTEACNAIALGACRGALAIEASISDPWAEPIVRAHVRRILPQPSSDAQPKEPLK